MRGNKGKWVNLAFVALIALGWYRGKSTFEMVSIAHMPPEQPKWLYG